MPWSALLVLAGLVVAGAWHIDAPVALLPEQVATHFAGDGRLNGWMTREGYRAFTLLLVTLLPLFMVAMAGWLPRAFPAAANIPNRSYWMAPQRREAALRFLAAHACWLGSLLVVFILGIHVLLVQTNRSAPVRLPEPAFFGALGGFALGLLLWIIPGQALPPDGLIRRPRMPDTRKLISTTERPPHGCHGSGGLDRYVLRGVERGRPGPPPPHAR